MADKRKKELVDAVAKLVGRRFAGDYGAAFQHYATKRSAQPSVDADELRELLTDAGVGNPITRGAWVRGIMFEVDRDLDGKISADEFRQVMQRG